MSDPVFKGLEKLQRYVTGTQSYVKRKSDLTPLISLLQLP